LARAFVACPDTRDNPSANDLGIPLCQIEAFFLM